MTKKKEKKDKYAKEQEESIHEKWKRLDPKEKRKKHTTKKETRSNEQNNKKRKANKNNIELRATSLGPKPSVFFFCF